MSSKSIQGMERAPGCVDPASEYGPPDRSPCFVGWEVGMSALACHAFAASDVLAYNLKFLSHLLFRFWLHDCL